MEAIKVKSFEPNKMPDNAVIKRVLNGEKELYEILMRRYNQTLFRVVRSYLKDYNDVQDVMQETYLKAFIKLYQFKEEATFSTWLIRIGINEALQKIRKRKRSKTVELDNDNEMTDRLIQLKDTIDVNPEEQTIYKETGALVEKAVDKLPEKYKIIYILYEVEGMEYDDIAKCLDISANNAKVRLHRAKNILKEMLYKMSSDKTIFEFGNKHCDRIVDYVMDNI